MNDPAIAAAQRAYEVCDGAWIDGGRELAVTAAREALAPLRELHRPVCEHSGRTCTYGTSCPMNVCPTCADDDWPCDTARLIYAKEEL